MIIPKQDITKQYCFHCGEVCPSKAIEFQEKHFCCSGCKMVYDILNENNLCEYYDLNNAPGINQNLITRTDKFAFLENETVRKKLLQFTNGKQSQITFYLPQIHCSSCLYLLENMYKLNDGVVESRVNFLKKEVFIIYNEDRTTLRAVVETLARIGYEPHLSLHNLDEKSLQKNNKTQLYKIGVSAFCFANIMMMSLPEYFAVGGVLEKQIGEVLQYLILLLSLPVLFYSATDFFKNAWSGLKHKHINIDFPIAVAILITFGRSLYEIGTHTSTGYLDSMSGIVFFMLIGRWLQSKTNETISFDRDFKSFFPISVNVISNAKAVPTTIDQLQLDDIIQIHQHELIPADCILSKGVAMIDYSFVTGESLPVAVNIGELVYAGGKQTGQKIELIVAKEVSQSYLTSLWNKNNSKTNEVKKSWIDAVGNYFTYGVLLLAALAAAYWAYHYEYKLMWNALTTVLIVACPCALLLSSTFTYGNLVRIFSRNKFYFRNTQEIENMAAVEHIVFDKTGTLTQTTATKINYNGKEILDTQLQIIASILSNSTHPVSKAVFQNIHTQDILAIEHYKEIEGKGIEAWYNNTYFKLGSSEFINAQKPENAQSAELWIQIDKTVFGCFTIKNEYRWGVSELLKSIKSKFNISVLSGDNDAEKETLSNYLGSQQNLHFNQKPENKLSYIEYLQHTKKQKVMMIGDGLNDAGALLQADFGVAVADDTCNFTPASAAVLQADKLPILESFIQLAKQGQQIIYTTFAISAIYNFIGLYFALQGTLSPVIAAILMPCSSISIILITFGWTQWLAKKHKL